MRVEALQPGCSRSLACALDVNTSHITRHTGPRLNIGVRDQFSVPVYSDDTEAEKIRSGPHQRGTPNWVLERRAQHQPMVSGLGVGGSGRETKTDAE